MAMNWTQTGRAKAEMNVTPLIDVLLVLLIIFMVITPLTSRGLPALVPQTPDTAAQQPDDRPVVLLLAADGQIALNHEKLTRREDLAERLRKIFQTRADRVLFIDAAPETEYGLVARVIDEAKLVASVGLLPRPPKAKAR
jgi:biopolymer transport protein TolR